MRELRALYRHTADDMEDYAMGTAEAECTYRSKLLADCSQTWLDQRWTEQLQSLFANLGAERNKRRAQVHQSHAVLDSILEADSTQS